MSILVEIAERADVSVEGVVRVLTREPVSDAIKERVLDVLDDLTPEQTRAVQRFALAALHDVLERPGHLADFADQATEGPLAPDPGQLALPVAAAEPDLLPTLAPDAALVQLSSVLGELAEAVRDLRRETDAERRERVDDLAVLIDLITTGWQGLDARLGRIERQVSRLESGRREFIAPPPARVVAPPPVTAAPAAAAPIEPAASAAAAPAPPPPVAPSKRDRLPFVAALALVGAAAITLAVLQLASGGPDLSGLVSERQSSSTTGVVPPAFLPATTSAATTSAATTSAETQPATTTPRPPTTTAPTTTQAEPRPATTAARPPAQRPTAPATTSDVLGTTAAGTARPRPPAATTAPGTTAAPPAATRPATTAATPPGFRPTRNWAWAPVQGADYYDVEFTRAGTVLYEAMPTEPRLTLPDSVVFRPGEYRWVVRPGFGARSARGLGAPVVDSAFTVS